MSVQYLKGVGPIKAKKLNKINIKTIRDLIHYFPRTYEDRRKFNKLWDSNDGEKLSFKVQVFGPSKTLRPRRGLTIIKIPIRDESGLGHLVWFNQHYMANTFKNGDIIKVNGKVKKVGKKIEIHNPTYEKEASNKRLVGEIIPIYSLTDKLHNNEILNIMDKALENYLSYEEEIIPDYIVKDLNLISLKEAIFNIHFPKNREYYLKARQRLVFEELLILQMGLLGVKNRYRDNREGIKFNKSREVTEFIDKLPFSLTNAQSRVLREITNDMESNAPMNRLLQGDVGSGKTIIATISMLKAAKSGYQSVLMAPTEILATQHYNSIFKLFNDYGIKVELLVGGLTAKKKSEILQKIEKGDVDVIIGTHAIIQGGVTFNNLGLAITDEQHRFGVRQRAKLSSKGKSPDVLVMTATPIPRTLGLILYGDLDISILDELPPGRKKIKTYCVTPSRKLKAYEFIKNQIREGRQAYIVCPLVEESESLNLNSATKLYEELKENFFNDINIGLLHGKMKPKEKDDRMKRFINNEIKILISTTVIEVGVNVPNASIMLVENAERFGLAQLHQLRGRVGRGEYQSYCILVNEGKSKVSKERMEIMEKSNDGFLISEKDLEIRGPGDFFGTKQHGLPDLKIANIFTDIRILKKAQEISLDILNDDPNLKKSIHYKLKEKIIKMFRDKTDEIIFN